MTHLWSSSWLALSLFCFAHLARCDFWPYQTFVSSDLEPPVMNIETSGAKLAPGYILIGQGTTTIYNTTFPKTTAPLIMTDTGELVWSGTNGTLANNLKVETLNGDSVLTYWAGIELAGKYVGHYYGAIYVLDKSYNQMYEICPQLNIKAPLGVTGPCYLDGHESLITDKGTMIFTVYNITTADLSSIGGPVDGWIYDNLFYEVDIATQEILYSWSSIEHVPVNATHNPLRTAGNESSPFDYFHINSVQPIGDGYLINARHTWSTYMIDNAGDVAWYIDGQSGGDFGPLPVESQFRWQHDARILNKNLQKPIVRWFNNYNAFQGNGTAPSNGLSLQLDVTKKTTTFISAFNDPADLIYSTAQGNNQLLPNGNTLLYYGLEPVGKEFGPKGDVRWSARFGPDNTIQSYRMFKMEWHADPATAPDVAVVNCTGYVSWNGATEVTKWAVYEGMTEDVLVRKRTVKKMGFETVFKIGTKAKYVMIEAYSGKMPLRNSSVVPVA